MEPIKRERIYEQVVREIQRSLAAGELRPGNRLPPERELAERLGISRPSLREALRVLEAMGIVDRKPGGVAFARASQRTRLATAFAPILADQRAFLLEGVEVSFDHLPSIRPCPARTRISPSLSPKPRMSDPVKMEPDRFIVSPGGNQEQVSRHPAVNSTV